MHDQVENDKLEIEQRIRIPLPPPLPGPGPIPISPFRRQEGSDTDSTNPVDGKRRKWLGFLLLRKHSRIMLDMNWIVELLGCFTPVGFHLTLQETHTIVIPMHMLLPIAFRLIFLLDIMPVFELT